VTVIAPAAPGQVWHEVVDGVATYRYPAPPFCMVGGGATVTRSLSLYALAIGSPARVRRWVCQCGQPVTFSNGAAVCAECHQAFISTGESIELLPVDAAISPV
jgi:hypothetical protein